MAAAAAPGGEFVEGWLVAQILGEGAYGEVRLLVHGASGARVALKAVRGSDGGAGEGAGAASREAAIHRALRHKHVLRCMGERAHGDTHYLFLEYAAGGELFERIEPDVGMTPHAAKRYWRQLAKGLRYIHSRGVAHRDIKPENLLLDAHDNIKISDFGMATVFRHGSRERLLTRVCGTVPYAAPEVLVATTRPYRAQPADVWAAAIVLVAMLAGELPWERACPSDPRFAAWCSGSGSCVVSSVWSRCGGSGGMTWLRRALCPDVTKRARLPDLLLDPWIADHAPHIGAGAEMTRGCLSQPIPPDRYHQRVDDSDDDDDYSNARDLTPADMDALLSSSQPAPVGGEGGSAAAAAAGGGLARVWVCGGAGDALRAAAAALRAAHCVVRRVDARTIAAECGGSALQLRVWVAGSARGKVLLQFRRWRGCGLMFQRRFAEVRAALAPLAAPPAPEPMDDDPMLCAR